MRKMLSGVRTRFWLDLCAADFCQLVYAMSDSGSLRTNTVSITRRSWVGGGMDWFMMLSKVTIYKISSCSGIPSVDYGNLRLEEGKYHWQSGS